MREKKKNPGWFLVVKNKFAERSWRVAKVWPIVIILVFGIILAVGVWRGPGTLVAGHDYVFHAARLRSAISGWLDGQLISQIMPEGLNGYGYGYNLFYGPLLTYITAILRLFTGGWVVAINLLFIVCLIGSGYTMYYCALKISRRPALATLAALIYMLAPYHLVSVYMRSSIAEVGALAISPILLLGLYQFVNHEPKALRKIVLAASMLILTHSLSAVLFAMMSVLFLLFYLKKIGRLRNWRNLCIAGVVIIGATAFFTLPILEAKKVGNYAIFDEQFVEARFWANAEGMNENRVNFDLLFTDEQFQTTNTRANIAIGSIAMIGMVGFWFVRSSFAMKERRFLTASWWVSLATMLMATTLVNWKYLPKAFYNMQFPWRFFGVFILTSSLVSAYVIFELMKKLSEERQQLVNIMIGAVASCAVLPVINTAGRGGMPELTASNLSAGYQVEYAGIELVCPKERKERDPNSCYFELVDEILAKRGKDSKVLEGEVEINQIKEAGTSFEATVRNVGTEEAVIELPRIYYPGYKAELNGEKLEIENSAEYGMVAVRIPAGAKGVMKLHYGMSPATIAGTTVSVGTILLCGWWLWHKNHKRR